MPDQLQPTILLDIAHIAIPWLATLTAVTNLKCCDFDYMSSHSFLTEMNAILGFVLVVSLLLALILYFPSNNNINTTGSVSTITLVVSALLWRTFSIALSMNVALLITPPNRVNELWSTPHPVEACERALLAYSLKTLRLFLCLRVVGEMVGGGQFVYRWINVRRSSESDPVKSIEEILEKAARPLPPLPDLLKHEYPIIVLQPTIAKKWDSGISLEAGEDANNDVYDNDGSNSNKNVLSNNLTYDNAVHHRMLELRSRLIETMKKCDILQFEKDLSENDVKRLMEALALNSLTTNVKSLVEMPKLSMVDQVNSTYAMEKKKRIEHDNLGGLDQLPFHPVQLDLEFSSLCPTPNRLQTPAPLGFYIMGDLSMIGYPIGIECDLPATRLMYASQLPCDAIMFALGPQHMMCVLPDERTVVCFGSNDEGQCGRLEGTVNSSDTETTVRSVDAWTCPSGRHIVKTVASDAASFVLLDDGSLWGWGTLMCNNLTNHEREMGDMDEADVTEVWGHLDPSTPLCYYPESPEFGIVDVSAASHFVCFIMRNGMIGSFGMAVDGELGYPPEKCEEGGRDSFMSPYARYLDDDENCRAVSVFAGYSQTFVLDDQGRCWAFGVNVQCQLGIEESRGPTIVEIPELIRGLPPCDIEPIVHVAVGERHVLFLTSAGRVFGCGDNRNSQLNVSRHNINVRDMVKRPILLADNITRVCCGSFHSVLMNVFGQVVVAGCNDGGQLGIRESENALLLPDTALIPYAVWEKRISHKHAWIKEEKLVGEMVQWKHGVESGSVQIYANSNITLLQIKK